MLTVDQALDHPQTKALEILQPTLDGKMSLIGLPLSFDGARAPLRRSPPALGADTDMILSDLFDWADAKRGAAE
jgi:crotonobetainyl-CoA:carnitine CoA-transferase CaiB-like acyl-CoA transferase